MDAILRGGRCRLDRVPVTPCNEQPIRAVHDDDYVTYLATVCEGLARVRPLPLRLSCPPAGAEAAGPGHASRLLLHRHIHAVVAIGLRCGAGGRGLRVTAADLVSRGDELVYALCRPPGHHAERQRLRRLLLLQQRGGGRDRLSARGRVALVDIDFHHGNGSQDIFYHRDDVLVVSLHRTPELRLPLFLGL